MNSNKRSRVCYDSDECETLTENSVDNALKDIYTKNEVSDPTRRKIRQALKLKLGTTNTSIKKNKKMINSIIDRYWIRRPQTKNGKNSKKGTKSKKMICIFTLPDVIEQKIFLYFHPKRIYNQIPFVCKWWDHLVYKKDFLTDIVHSYLKIQCPSPLTFATLLPHLQHCCSHCANANLLNKNKVDAIVTMETKKLSNNQCKFIKVPFDNDYCQNCFEKYEEYQAILCETAKDLFQLNDKDLAPIKQQYNPFLFSLKLYGRVSDVKEIAIEKFGSLSVIDELTPFEIGSIEKSRDMIIKKEIRKLKKELINDSIKKQNAMKKRDEMVSSLFEIESDSNSDEYDASFVEQSVSRQSSHSKDKNDIHENSNHKNSNSENSENSENNENNESENEENNFENVVWPTAEMMKNARKNYSNVKKESNSERENMEISRIELDKKTIECELDTFFASKEYNHFFGYAFYRGSKNNIKLTVGYNEIFENFQSHLQRVRLRKWKIRQRSNDSWYQDWYDSTWTNDFLAQR